MKIDQERRRKMTGLEDSLLMKPRYETFYYCPKSLLAKCNFCHSIKTLASTIQCNKNTANGSVPTTMLIILGVVWLNFFMNGAFL